MSRQVVLITGGSRGIGAAVARLAAGRGYDVAVNFRTERGAAEAVAEECRALGAAACTLAGDMSVEADIVRVFDEAERLLGPVRHVVNNAGITGRSSRLEAADTAVIRACIDLNVTGAILVAREAARRLATGQGGPGGSIVNISSVAATLGSPGEYVWYAASKGAVDALTIGLAKELAQEGVRVNAVSPGLVETEIHARSTGDAGRMDRIAPLIPMGRIGQPEEIAEAVLFLMSDGASYTTGANLRVTGGR
ncbi:SDR family oxidoreductase [Enterovirga aerilata]|uniref:SDR family oxidoreductase n=1 Tax=Enterovirga aerilata TaxID=2730920 RepID=A0A849I2P6_9HYPH|nr:SDR family oxidoreductase [Enterovirga sp. DB1703]